MIRTGHVSADERKYHQSDERRGDMSIEGVNALDKQLGRAIESLHYHVGGSLFRYIQKEHVQRFPMLGKGKEGLNVQKIQIARQSQSRHCDGPR